ncbi:mediator of RNA polymerase II transcription subunit 17-like isoform X1 [Leptotrombidium deliense]|uniref:Mediator of RNA polymerase II transcription subunit 17 n=1 Tax=Leptotrombidium deliense TaxID=299467 RepID=A0A443SP53_9ACAR|nr:mediator of RNA polymerase II transcription subunit 17-like isoform X1 [Leptotrombidium deliense]
MSLAANVSLETSDEYVVQEITYDGQEKYITPLSMSEHLSKLAQKIDFSHVTSYDECETEKVEDSAEDNKDSAQLSWPWESVRTKLKTTLTELCVLLDDLLILKDKRYLVLDPVSQEPLEFKPLTSVVARKKALAASAAIIQNGVESLKSHQNDVNRRAVDFHSELMTIRQNWRMKKVGNSILGDLSYRSAGSRYPHSGTFEVSKAPSPPQQPVSSPQGAPSPRASALKVTVPSDLEGVSYIHVSIHKDNDSLASGDLSIPLPPAAVSSLEASWQQKLENAQNVLFCKELFAQLAREAVQLQLPIPTLVVGNQIIATLFPGVQLSIGLCHTTVPNKKIHEKQQPPSRSEHKPVLEHSLHQLLREIHFNALHHPMPHPSTATLGISRKKYFAGSEAYDRHTLAESCKSETMLEHIISQSQHVVLRLRTMYMIDTLACEIKDPLIVAHWLCLNSATRSCVKINIVSHGYEILARTPIIFHVGVRNIKAVCRDGRTFKMSYESQELRYLIMSQHQINAVQALSKLMGWKVLSHNTSCGVGPVETIGTASSVVLASPNGDRMIAVRHGPQSGAQVSVSLSPHDQDFYPSTLVRDRKWQNVNGRFKEVMWEKIEGKNLVSKIEYLMACLTSF